MGDDNGTGPKLLDDKASHEWPALHIVMPKKGDGHSAVVATKEIVCATCPGLMIITPAKCRQVSKVSHHKSLKPHTPLVTIDLVGGR